MKDKDKQTLTYHAIADIRRDLSLGEPRHPLVSMATYTGVKPARDRDLSTRVVLDFYKVSFIYGAHTKIRYGQRFYDFRNGGLCFVAPGQVMSATEGDEGISGRVLFFHPDFIRDRPLGKKLKDFGFFSYSVSESLYLSDEERDVMLKIFDQIETELLRPADQFSDDLITMQIDLLLTYSNRFYARQFLTEKNAPNNDLLVRFDEVMAEYFAGNKAQETGLPTVQYVSDKLHYSPDYLSDMLRVYTGLNTQQHIQNKLIERAKEVLSSSNVSVAEVAYQLGFEHPQSFNKLFKRKTNVSPLAYRLRRP